MITQRGWLLVAVLCLSSPAHGQDGSADSTSTTGRGPSGARRVGAVAVDAYVGFGTGQLIMGNVHKAAIFAAAEVATVGVFAAGIFVGASGRSVGLPVAYSGAGAYIGLRLWEFGDVLVEARKGGASADHGKAGPVPPPSPRVRLLPLAGGSARGVGLSVSF